MGEGTARVPPGIVERILKTYAHLDPEQADGVRSLLTSGNGYDLVIGQAGTGKSTMLGAARAGWEEVGYKVIGTAVAARTAADLEAGTGIPSSSLTQLLADLKEGGGLTSRHVIVVDEASLVGSRSLDRLRSYVDGAGAKLVLTGDNRQLSSIDAGGALRSLSNELGEHVVTLTTNRRQAGSDQQWEREALVALRDGEVERAVHAYTEHGRVTISGTIDEARQRLVEDWWAVHHGHTTAILAVRRADVVALNDMVRARRQAGGELGQEVILGTKAFSVGDRVLFEKNQRVKAVGQLDQNCERSQARIRNGTFGTIIGVIDAADNPVTWEGDVPRAQGDVGATGGRESRAESTSTLVVELHDGRQVVLPRSYAETSTSLGYALTVFRSQGITVDHTFGLGGDGLFQEAGYTQLSRGRLSNTVYVAAPDNPRWEIGHAAEDARQRDALESLIDALSHTQEQTMAQDHLPTWTAASSDDISMAYRQRATIERYISDHAPPDVTDQLASASARAQDARISDGDRASAQVDLSGLAAEQHRRDVWITGHRDEITTWWQLDRTVRRYEYRLGQAAGYSAPEHLTRLLGNVPERITATERWQTAAGSIEAYRARWNIAGPITIGLEPTDPEQRAHWRKTVAVVATAGFLAAGDSLGAGPEREVLADVWHDIQTADYRRNDDRDPGPGPEPHSTRIRHTDRGLDDAFGI
jgi:hypothetical protein